MRISIITPNYNYGRFLQKAIDAVFQQNHSPPVEGRLPHLHSPPAEGCLPHLNSPPAEGWRDSAGVVPLSIEHIVIDGGSTDASVDILKAHCAHLRERFPSAIRDVPPMEVDMEWKPDAPRASGGIEITGDVGYRFRWISEPDRGQTHAINKGFRQATGDILCWLNADEIYRDGALQKVAQAFEAHPRWDVLYGEIDFLRDDGSILRHKFDHPFVYLVLLWYGCYITSAATFWRRSVYGRVGALDERYRVTMDYDYWMRMAKHRCRFGFLPETLAGFMYHDGNVSVQFDALRRQEERRVKRPYDGSLIFGGSAYVYTTFGIGLALRQLFKLWRRLR